MRWSRLSEAVRSAICVVAVLLFAFGCDRDDSITSYQAPKDNPPVAIPLTGEASGQPDNSDEGLITWTVPAGWKRLASTAMRYAAFEVSPTDPAVQLTVIPLGQEAGELLPNLNRWERELGLTPSSQVEAPKRMAELTLAGAASHYVDLVNGQKRMLAVMIPHEDRIWFIKLVGPASLVTSQKANFDAFVKSMRFKSDAGTQVNSAPTAPEVVGGLTFATDWKAPANWSQEPPKPMRFVSWSINRDGQSGELIVTRLDASGFGSLLANVNRWRGQVGLEPLPTDASINPQSTTINGLEMALFDFTGPKSGTAMDPARIVVAMTVHNQDVWFFKLQGPSQLVAKERGAFDSFLAAVKFQ